MTEEGLSLTSGEALNAELRSLLLKAHRNGIEVEGGWDCTNGAEYPDWDVVVTEVRRDERSEPNPSS